MVAAELANLGEGRPRVNSASLQSSLLPREETGLAPISQAAAAEMLNVSTRSVAAAVSIRDKGVPELKDRVRSGEVSVSDEAVIVGGGD